MESKFLNPTIVSNLPKTTPSIPDRWTHEWNETHKCPQTLPSKSIPELDGLISRPRQHKGNPKCVYLWWLSVRRLKSGELSCNSWDIEISGITSATSSLTAGMDACGTNTAHSMRLSCPLISVLRAVVSISVIRAVWYSSSVEINWPREKNARGRLSMSKLTVRRR